MVVFMGLEALAEIAAGLIARGCEPGTPVAVIARGTTSDQQAVISTLDGVTEAAEGVDSPALIVLGDVVGLASVLGDRLERVAAEA